MPWLVEAGAQCLSPSDTASPPDEAVSVGPLLKRTPVRVDEGPTLLRHDLVVTDYICTRSCSGKKMNSGGHYSAQRTLPLRGAFPTVPHPGQNRILAQGPLCTKACTCVPRQAEVWLAGVESEDTGVKGRGQRREMTLEFWKGKCDRGGKPLRTTQHSDIIVGKSQTHGGGLSSVRYRWGTH